MKQQLVIALPGPALDAGTGLHWQVFGGGAPLAGGHTALGQLREALAPVFLGGTTTVLVPGELVLLTAVHIPSRQLRHIKQALPYMVEELIADNIEDVHLALPEGRPAEQGETPVAVVRHHLLIHWLDQLYQHGLQPDALLPDSLAVPWREHGRTFFLDGERVIYRDGLCRAQVMFRPQLSAFLDLLRESGDAAGIGAVPRVEVAGGPGEPVATVATMVQQALDAEVESTAYAETAAEVMAATALGREGAPINLLQGGYNVQRRGGADRRWRRVGFAAAMGLGLYIVVAAASGTWLSWRAEQLREDSVALYRELFPQERRVLSPRKQMAAHLAGGGGAVASPLPLLARTASGLEGGGVRVEQLQYRRQNRELQVQLRAPSLEALDRVKQALDSQGLGVEIGSAVQQDGATQGRITVREDAS